MSECERKGKWIRGCSFEPVYDKEPADLSQLKSLRLSGEEYIEKFRKVTFVAAVCRRCGKLVDRNSSKDQ